MERLTKWAGFLGIALALAAGFSAELLASKTCCCSQICDESSIGLFVAADNSPSEVNADLCCNDNLQSVAIWTAEFDAAVWSQYGELPAVYREFATAATEDQRFFQYAVSVNYSRNELPIGRKQSRAWTSDFPKSPRDLITGFAKRNDGYNPANLRWY